MKTNLFKILSVSLAAGAFLAVIVCFTPGQAHAQTYNTVYYPNQGYTNYNSGYNNGMMNNQMYYPNNGYSNNYCSYNCYGQSQYTPVMYYYYPVYYYATPIYYYPSYYHY